MARTALWQILQVDVVRRNQLVAKLDLVVVPVGGFIRHVEHLTTWAEVCSRITVALEAPSHCHRFVLPNTFHLVDRSVTSCAAYAIIDVR